MNISDIIQAARNSDSFSNIIPLTSLKTAADVEAARGKDIPVALTVDEFKEKYPDVDVECIYFGNPLSSGAYYWNPDSMVIFPIQIINGDYLSRNNRPLKQHIDTAISKIKEHIERNDYRFIATALNDRMRVEYLKMLIDKDMPNIYELFSAIYPICDFGCSSLSVQDMEKLLSRKTDGQKERTLSMLEHLPPIVTVYRGCGSESTALEDAFSWSLNSAVAIYFATRYTTNDSRIYAAKVKREDIFEYIDGGEQECLILPDKLFDVQKTDFYDIDWMNEMDEVAHKYLDYRDGADYDRIDFEMDSSIHGKAHSMRVLLFSLFLADLYGLDEEDEQTLADAALYHDTGRRNDAEDRHHGTISAKKYKRVFKYPDPVAVFLMKYHCKPDSEGYAAIDNDTALSAQKERVIQLFKIFKDADALDRLRLGNFELDYTRLRTDEAKKLPLVARLTQKGLKVE